MSDDTLYLILGLILAATLIGGWIVVASIWRNVGK